MKKLLFAVLVSLAFALPVQAQTTDAPALSFQRVLITAGVDYAYYDSLVVGSDKRWEIKPSVNIAYNLGKWSSLVGSYSRGLASDKNEYRVGVRVRLYRGLKD